MKKFSIFLMAFLGLVAVGCDEEITPAQPQHNEQEPILTTGDIETATAGALASDDVINLEDYTGALYGVPAVQTTKAENLDAEAVVQYRIQLSATDDFANVQTLTLVTDPSGDPNLYYIDAFEWNDAQVKLFGLTTKPVTVYYRVPVYVELAATDFRYESDSYYALSGTMTVKRMDPGYVVEESYYVFGSYVGGNSPASAVQMSRTEADVYDDPVFNYFFEVTEDQAASASGYTLMVAPESVHNASGSTAACYGAGSEEGVLVLGGVPIVIAAPGSYKFSVNMETLTYTLGVAPKTLYVIGIGQNFTNVAQLPTTDYVNYEGTAGILGQWCLTGQNSYRPTVFFGTQSSYDADTHLATGTLAISSDGTPLSPTTGAAMPGDHAGLNYFKVNVANLTYEATYLATMGLCGTQTGWADDADEACKSSRTTGYMTWTVTTDLTTADEFKIRANGGWDFSWGTDQVLTDGGTYELSNNNAPNMKVAADGNYTLTFDFKAQPATVTVKKN